MSKVGQEVGSKLSVKSFGWDKEAIQEAVFKEKENDVFLARFGGVATGLKPYKIKDAKPGDDETGYGLMGSFKGVGSDGSEQVGSVLYLPRYVHDMVQAALTMHDDVAGVRIGFDVYARYNKDAATSYVFTACDILNEGNASVDDVMNTIAALPMPGSPEAAKLTDETKGAKK